MPTDNNNKLKYNLNLIFKIVKEFGLELKPESLILDFGCGKGKFVQELSSKGYTAFGCDVKVFSDENIGPGNNILRTINLNPYRIPFEDNSFDFIFSFTVFEHVQNYSEAISELARVLKPNGVCLHLFPSRYSPIESHIFVPFASTIQSYWWLYLWAFLGIRNEFQDRQSVKEIAESNYHFLKENTNYLTKKSLQKYFREHFNDIIFCEQEFLKYSHRGKYLYPLTKITPIVPSIYSTFRGRVILTRKPHKTFSMADSYSMSAKSDSQCETFGS